MTEKRRKRACPDCQSVRFEWREFRTWFGEELWVLVCSGCGALLRVDELIDREQDLVPF